ncbi:hypothetical protein FOIG_13532 [Fusarium odoratissimum NRRL 54006]|uniref:Saccharopine dehydrogenase-like C-terminal domain-containing protein n=1 Tax=Fusarium odoratissimum (strain NRRL 54006) TaxID=1089451 RepID=X0JAM6_FUSO5|nr:uncharacterized protein FOIG_13532 [Fusarium odoratissimum NRRL 54006]EXL93396.1 hypothetical protein FOIG_13532 [Fusarium odoratissimum NRRL 54006]
MAKSSGVIIIPAISGSSAPSDLVAWLIAGYLRKQGLHAASEIVSSGKLSMLRTQGGSLHTVLDVAETYGIGGWLTSDTSVLLPDPKHVVKKNKGLMGHHYDQHLEHLATSFVAPATGLISALLMHIVTKLGIFLLAVPWFRSFVRGKSFDRGSGPDRDGSRKIESAEWKAVGYVTGKEEPVAFAKFSYKGALVDMAVVLAVEAAATINQMNKSEATGAGLLTPSTLGYTFVDRLRAAGFDLTVDGLETH